MKGNIQAVQTGAGWDVDMREGGVPVFYAATGYDQTAEIAEFFNDLSSDAAAAKKIVRMQFSANQEYLTQGNFLRSNIDIDFNGSTLVKIANFSGDIATSETVGVLRTGPWTKSGNSFYGRADNITIRNGTLNANNKWALGVMDLYGVRNFRAIGITTISSQWAPQWQVRGGGRDAKFIDCRVLGGSRLFQDGIHWAYGWAQCIGCFVESGDDAFVAGNDAVTGNVNQDDEELVFFEVIGGKVVATRGAAFKGYRALDAAFSSAPNNYTKTKFVRGFRVDVSGDSGLLRNGGVAVFSHRTPDNRTLGELSNGVIKADLDIGTDGTAVWSAVSGTLVGSPTAVTAATPPVVTLNSHGLTAGEVVVFLPAVGGMNNLANFYQVGSATIGAPTTNTFTLSDNPYRSDVALTGTGFTPWTTGQLLRAKSGSGYVVGEDLTLAGGTYVRPAVYRVTDVDANGAVLAVRRIDEGEYSVLPSTPNSPTGGSGTGAQLWLELTHNGINAFGSHCVGADNVQITGNMRINDTTGSATRFMNFEHIDCARVKIDVEFPNAAAGGSRIGNESQAQLSRKNKVSGRIDCKGTALGAALSPLMLLNSEDTEVDGLVIDNLPSNTGAIQFPIGGNTLGDKNIAGISAAAIADFGVSHPGWQVGDYVQIVNNVLSAGSFDGYYVIDGKFGATSLFLKDLSGNDVALAGRTVTTLGQMRLANNTAKIRNVTIRKADGATGTTGIASLSTSPHRVSAVVIQDCNLSAMDTPIGANVALAPIRYVSRDNKT